MAAKCNKFLPNIFNKTKCQHCFAAKEAHSAEALENNKASRKVSKCGYLFVSPGFDFNNPLDRSKRWQRRFFVLYDDGELTYSVDENPDTVPQCTVDMNKCTEVADAEKTTTHHNSLSIATPEKTVYIKGNSKEEIQWWHDILAEFPKALKAIRPRRKQPYLILSNKENLQPESVDSRTGSEHKNICFDVDKVKSRSEGPVFSTFRGVRSLKHKYDSNHQEGLRKSSSLHDLSSDGQDLTRDLESSRFLSRSGDRLDIMSCDTTFSLADSKKNSMPSNLYFSMPRSTWTRTGQPIPAAFSPKNNPSHTLFASHFNSSSSLSSTSSTNSAAVPRRGSLDDHSHSRPSERGTRVHRERSSSLKEFPTQLSLAKTVGEQAHQHSISADETDSNETDELKMARSSELSAAGQTLNLISSSFNPASSSGSQYEDLVYMKKGWLIKQSDTEKESRKHWFVLAGNSLRYYKDTKAEECNILDGRIDLSSCFEVSEINTSRNYGFKIKTRNGEYTLAAMTSGIRNNWMKAIRLFMEIHNSASHRGMAGPISKSLSLSPHRALDDFEVKSGNATISTAAVKGASGETAFQLVGRVEPQKREIQKNVRRHYSDVNPGNVSQVLTVKEFSLGLDSPSDPASSSPGSGKSSYTHKSSGSTDLSKSSPTSEISSRISTLKRFVEGSEHFPPHSSVSHSGDFDQSKHKKSVTSESNKEEVKREMMRRAKSPSARVKERSRASKTSRLHSPITMMDDSYNWSAVASDTGSAMSDTLDDLSFTYTDIPMPEDFPATEDTDHEDLTSAGTSDLVGGEDTLVEILETEVESLKDRLEHTQTELDKMQKDNIDLKSRLHKESTQSLDSGYSNSSRWSQSSSQPEMLKRQLKEARDTVQRQRLDIESLKSKLDMSVSKLTGTEKALSEALRDYKQEKDKFLKLSTEWNRRIRTLEENSKEGIHKLERSRENLQAKERECRRLEAEVKSHLQRSREQEREILKLKAVEHEYNQLKEKLDDREHELLGLRSELNEKEHVCKRIKDDYEKQMDEMEQEYAHERDCLENHLEQLKMDLYSVHDRQASMTDNMTSSIADMLREKDDIIAQLEDKVIDADKKIVELSEEIQSERGMNSELAHDIDVMQEDKIKLESTIDRLESQSTNLKNNVSGFKSENLSLLKQLEELRKTNEQLQNVLQTVKSDNNKESAPESMEPDAYQTTVKEMNQQIQDLKEKLQEAENTIKKASVDREESNVSSISSMPSDYQEDLLHNIILIDSHLKEVNSMLFKLRQNFDAYIASESTSQKDLIRLADQIEDIGQKCQNMQDVLRDPQENILPAHGEEYKHETIVDASSDNKLIFSEYKGLKLKFDQVVAELQQMKKQINSSSDQPLTEYTRLKERIEVMEGAFKQQVIELIARVDSTNESVDVQDSTSQHPLARNPFSNEPDDLMKEIEAQIQGLSKRLSFLENKAVTSKVQYFSNEPSSQLSENMPLTDSNGLVKKLEDIKSELADSSLKLENLVSSFPSDTSASKESVSQIQQCELKLTSLSNAVKAQSKPQIPLQAMKANKEDSSIAAEGISHCMFNIRERIQEVGELLDSLEEDGEDSDSEEEGEGTTVEDVREKLASLVEYIEQHSKLSTSDWATLRLLSVQKSNLDHVERPKEIFTDDDKLKMYSDKLSLEAVILHEMAHILQNKDFLTPEDSLFREIDTLNSELLFLHQRLDDETKTMHFDTVQADLLSSYSELLAEKILMNTHLCSDTFDQRSHTSVTDNSDSNPSVQSLLLATEALVRSQIDSHISQNLDRSIEEIISLPTHLVSRAIVQGDLTFALRQLKSRLEQSPEVLKAGPAGYKFVFDRLMDRQIRLMASLESYESQMIHSLAVIIWKESEEMTIVDVPESVLDAMCSELSTIMERHIQHHKERCRSAKDMNSARKFDIIVNKLRTDREIVLGKIKSHHEAYAKDQTSIRDSSLDVPVQSLDNSISNFGEILSLKAIVTGSTDFLSELLKMGNSVLEDLDLDLDSDTEEESKGIEKGLTNFVSAISEALQAEAFSKATLSKKLMSCDTSDQDQVSSFSSPTEHITNLVLRMPSLTEYPKHLSERATLLVREAVFSAQLTFSMFKMKVAHDREVSQLKSQRPLRLKPQKDNEESKDSEEHLELQADFEALLLPLEEVLESKHEDEVEVLQVVLNQVSQMKLDISGSNLTSQAADEHFRQLEQKLHHEIDMARQRHKTHLEVFKQESSQLEKTIEEQQQDHDHYEERCAQLEEELTIMQINHEEEKERMKQDILTAVHAIKSNDEKSESHLTEKASKLNKELAIQKLNFRKILGTIKKDIVSKDKNAMMHMIDGYQASISINTEDEEEDYQPPLPDQPPPSLPIRTPIASVELPVDTYETSKALDMSHHEQEVEQLKKEKEEALAEEMRNTKAALDAMRKAYEEELVMEKAKYKEALVTMYTEEYVNEIRLRHQEEEEHLQEELQKINIHYSSKCEDYKLLEMRMNQTKQDLESHLQQLISSNNHLEEMLNKEIDSMKDFIRNKPSAGSLTTGSATLEEELYDAKIMMRVKDAELQKLRSQVKTLENSLQRTTEEQRQTMTQYMQSLKTLGENKKQYQCEVQQLTERLNKVLGSQGLKANIKRTPSFHQRARSPSPQPSTTSPRKDSDHSSRDSHRRRHIQPKDLRRSKSSPSLPYVFDGKGVVPRTTAPKIGRRSRSPKT